MRLIDRIRLAKLTDKDRRRVMRDAQRLHERGLRLLQRREEARQAIEDEIERWEKERLAKEEAAREFLATVGAYYQLKRPNLTTIWIPNC